MPGATGNWETVNTALYTMLQSLSGEGLRMATVSDWPNPAPANGYPHVFPLPLRKKEVDYDTAANKNKIFFILRIEFPEPGTRESHLDMLKSADALETEIRQKTHAGLGGVVHNFQVGDNGEFARTGEGEAELIVYDVVVSAEVLKDIA